MNLRSAITSSAWTLPLVTVSVLALIVLTSAGWTMQEDSVGRRGDQIITLTAMDDLTCSFSFAGGRFGDIREGRLFLDETEMLFDRYQADRLSFGYVRDMRVNLVDLGDERIGTGDKPGDRAPRTPISVYHRLFLDGDRIKYLDAYGNAKAHRLAQKVLHQFGPEQTIHIEPRIGHTYLLRYRTSFGASETVRFRVLDHEPGRYVTLRWGLL
ncbi:MAG: hypothetical protein DHS20C21_21550 [Gemmatimonadota bacterium]|nr:MAG: hypothetical protein DHS20C21_21550 [Gemmatimonadota bacterium]